MKRVIFLLLCTCFLAACSVSKRITVMDNTENGLKRIRLEQSPDVKPGKEKGDLPGKYFKSLSTVYLFEEKPDARPEITLDIQLLNVNSDNAIDSLMIINLDDEKIKLISHDNLELLSKKYPASTSNKMSNRKYFIPENLWISIVHSKEIAYHIFWGKVEIDMVLSQAEKEQLAEFLKLSMEQRDAKFPAVPEGQVKW